MKVEAIQVGSPYNEFGCGYRLLFLVINNQKSWFRAKDRGSSILLNRRLNKLVEYWNYHGNRNGRESIFKNIMFVPIDTLNIKESLQAIETEKYGYWKREYLSKYNLYYKKGEIKR